MKRLIITPMAKERKFLVQHFQSLGIASKTVSRGRLQTDHIPHLGVTVAQGGHGKVQFATQTQHLIDSGRPWDLVLCVGAAGALAEGLAVGDVVVGTATVEHDYKGHFSHTPSPVFSGDEEAIEGLKFASDSDLEFGVHFGLIASGDEDIVDRDRREDLHKTTEALAVAWEGAGGARACKFSQVPFLEMRAITDSADHNAPSDFEVNLRTAMKNAAELTLRWLNSGDTR